MSNEQLAQKMQEAIKNFSKGIENEKAAILKNPCKMCQQRGRKVCGCGGGGGSGGGGGGGDKSSETSQLSTGISTEKLDTSLDAEETFVFDSSLFFESDMEEKLQQILHFIEKNFDFILAELSKYFSEINHELLNGVDLSGCKATLVGRQLFITLPNTMSEEQQKTFEKEFENYMQRTFKLTPELLGLTQGSIYPRMFVFQRGPELKLTKEQESRQQALLVLKNQINNALVNNKIGSFSTVSCKAEIHGQQLRLMIPETIKEPKNQKIIVETFKALRQEVEEESGLTFTQANIHIQYGGKKPEARHTVENEQEQESAFKFKTPFDLSIPIPRCEPKGS